jgi:lipoyl(octanoyl) transferase
VDPEGAAPRKIGALGLRIERGVSYHGIALNVDPDLDDFRLIDPCGMPGVISTSMAAEAGAAPEVSLVAATFAVALERHLRGTLEWWTRGDLEDALAAGRDPAPHLEPTAAGR